MRRAIFQCQQIQHVEEAAWDAYQWSDIHRELVDTHDVLHVKKKENVIEKIEQEAALLSRNIARCGNLIIVWNGRVRNIAVDSA